MFWKQRPAENSRANEQGRFYSQLREAIPSLRKQGEPPQKDLSSFSKYHCDLCNNVFPLTGLRQCTLCGRWACPSCWTQEFYVCNSCHGAYKLHVEPFLPKDSVKDE